MKYQTLKAVLESSLQEVDTLIPILLKDINRKSFPSIYQLSQIGNQREAV